MQDVCYWKVKVAIFSEDAKGNVKKKTEEYLVHAVSPTDAEVKIHEEFKTYGDDWEITSVTQTKIVSIIT